MRLLKCFGLGTALQLLQCKLADRLEHRKADLGTDAYRLLHEALADERLQPVQDIKRQLPVRTAHRLRGLQRPATREHRQHTEYALVNGGKQIVAPIEGAPKRLLPCG